ncbi:hypothetical protein [Acaryochloris sp. IP29b_bin.148]|uniref:hypothetical protein n=1 Tax=Acaryochloris sp. IP29b_bin.148 TaxID=2969218 RepID=UPI00261816EB|nr:hypothetical protein [Acaryochloris sp. IP29b_bin.148]
MKKQLEQRLQQLKAEFESGQQVLAELEEKRANIQNTLLRIQGAIQVLEEELAKAEKDTTADSTDNVDAETLDAANGRIHETVEALSSSNE